MSGKKLNIDRIRISTKINPILVGYAKVFSAYQGININELIEISLKEYFEFSQSQYKQARQELRSYASQKKAPKVAFTTTLDRTILNDSKVFAKKIGIPLNILIEIVLIKHNATHKEQNPLYNLSTE